MGHKGDIERTYSLNKQQLPDHLVQEIRSAYKKCESLLQTRVSSSEILTEEKAKDLMKISLFTSLGFTEEEISKQKLLESKEEEIQQLVKSKLLTGAKGDKMDEVYAKPEDADQLRNEGYSWAGNLPDGRIVMRL